MNNDGISILVFLVVLIVALIIYFIPAITADARKHNHTMAITMLNLFLGWTFIGWVAALVWACMNDVKQKGA